MSLVGISKEVVCSFQPSKAFQNHDRGSKITSLDFDDQGGLLLSTGQDNVLNLYDARAGKFDKVLPSKKYGCHLARFTHTSTNCVHASTMENDTIRYLSLHDNQYIRYFKGHKKKVIGLEVAPSSDKFLSSSLDNTIRLWDLNSANCHGLLTIPSPAYVTFDPAGVVFAAACEQTAEILLYDLRKYEDVPFSVFRIDSLKSPARGIAATPWSKIEFSNDGKKILVSTYSPAHYILDAFSGQVMMKLLGASGYSMPTGPDGSRLFESSGDTCFSPDGRFVFAGSKDKVIVWDLLAPVREGALRPIAALDSPSPVNNILFNPRNMMLATSDENLVFWLPDKDDKTKNS
ncbi:WD40-repeat-containing domain protein [Lipomyces oligophaga]|uniref:WD40-repeat-containing domain protein n=1 Tax=Lipomyces oligophaga TaxID=45792 RepID=UPI0034CDEB2D